MTRWGSKLASFAVVTFLPLVLAACGGGGNPSGPGPVATPTPGATPTPAPAPTPNPTPDPRANLSDGPVVTYTIKLRSVQNPSNGNYRDLEQDTRGFWIVKRGDFVVFDSTQRNGSDRICKWVIDPQWNLVDPGSVVDRRDSSNPFLLRIDIARSGDFTVRATIDGVVSNELSVVAQ
jgi:hypothetical protein